VEGMHDVTVSDITINSTNGGSAFVSKSSSFVHLEGCYIYGSTQISAIAFYSSQGGTDQYEVENNLLSEGNVISNNIIDSPVSDVMDGVIFMKQKNGCIQNNTLTGSRIAFYLCRGSIVSGNAITESKSNGIRCTVPAYDNLIEGNHITVTKASGISVVTGIGGIDRETYRASGFTIINNTINDTRYFGIEISNLENSEISGNHIDGTDFSGMYLLFCNDLQVTSNHIWNASLSFARGKEFDWNQNLNSGIFADYMVANSNFYFNEIMNTDELNPTCPFGVRIQDNDTNHDNEVVNNVITGYFTYATSMKTNSPQLNIDTPNQINLYEREAPTNINTVSSNNEITISWDAMAGGFGYFIEVDGHEIDLQKNTTYVHTGLLEESIHNYRVRVLGGKWSDVITASTNELPKPTSIEAADLTVTEKATVSVNAEVLDQFHNPIVSAYSLKYAIADTNIAVVDQNGNITANDYTEGNSTTTLTIAIDELSLSKSITISVTSAAIVIPPVVQPDNPPVVQPDNPPVVQPDNPPVVQPDNPPVVQPDNPPVVQPDNSPVVQPDNPPIVQPDNPLVVQPDNPPVVQPENPPEIPDTTSEVIHNLPADGEELENTSELSTVKESDSKIKPTVDEQIDKIGMHPQDSSDIERKELAQEPVSSLDTKEDTKADAKNDTLSQAPVNPTADDKDIEKDSRTPKKESNLKSVKTSKNPMVLMVILLLSGTAILYIRKNRIKTKSGR
ncbi:MAG TPA: right-handed parallel beta-helix repeat-containing protein, partial [Lachnospiraceae bacterium]|nr:right-handed parallel beta-helix repeat-containing protein [Lachnospiraceae bacterium]